ncbi:hypothetical protein JXA88_09285 [Candidatus Fermentibacteria bacterium]|nr:hypothetical protein [Candidatus Fermentibacteria bacterium]
MSRSNPPSTRRFRHGDLEIAFVGAPAISYAFHHCHIPIIDHIEIVNRSDSSVEPFTLTIDIPGYALPLTLPVHALGHGAVARLAPIPLQLCYDRLQGLEARRYATLSIAVDGHVVFRSEVLVLGFYEWSLAQEARKTLACYVQPGQFIIQQILADAGQTVFERGRGASPVQSVGDGSEAEDVVRQIYETLQVRYNLQYVLEAPSYETDGQAIRPPHRVIPNPHTRAGAGTCIDLSLLFASCLESVHLQPVVIVVCRGEHADQHAMVGCWRTGSERLEPVIESQERIREAVRSGRLLPLEATGVTLYSGHSLPFREAVDAAQRRLDDCSLEFALDVAAARHTVVPLEFPLSPGALSILGLSQTVARRVSRGTLESRHLLEALRARSGQRVRSFLSAEGVASRDDDWRADVAVHVSQDDPPRATLNYRRCIDDARAIAGDCGAGFVEEEHLLYAILLSPSRGIDQELARLDADRTRLLRAFERDFLWTRDLVSTEHGSASRIRSSARRRLGGQERSAQHE